ncbi:syncytin-A-like isoform X1 [Ambystoma mexicanum]|uniref:syncytin-A-like isoform X1 n=1 Tax=Ambystoma mexicanum TaxID=8296 RepID=UPI0037E72751
MCTPIWTEHISKLTWVTTIENPFKLQKNISYELCFHGEGKGDMGRNKNCSKTLIIPDMKKGTAALMDTYWVCGNVEYLHLPQSWRGTCSMATVHSARMVIPESHVSGKNQHEEIAAEPSPIPQETVPVDTITKEDAQNPLKRNKQSSNYIYTKSSELLAQIPDRYRLFSTAETCFASLVPSVQTRANAKWLQITRWDLIQLANDTEEGFNVITVELRALRLMMMQNLLMAIDGGVCRKIGSACCTFIPSVDAENGSLSHVIAAVHNLGERMKDEGGAQPSTWFDSLFSWVPSWLGMMVKLLVPLVVFFLLIFLCVPAGTLMLCKCSTKRRSNDGDNGTCKWCGTN